MKYIKYFESKQIGILYHYTNPISAISILKSDNLSIGQYGCISFTRNKYYHLKTDLVREGGVRFVFNGDNLSNNNKIYPYSHWGKNKTSKSKEIYNEYEERCNNDIRHIKKYIITIEIDKLKCLQWFVSDSLVATHVSKKELLEAEKLGINRYKNFLKEIKSMYTNIKYKVFYK